MHFSLGSNEEMASQDLHLILQPGVKPGSTEVLRLISEIFLLLQCVAAGSARALDQADHALAQV